MAVYLEAISAIIAVAGTLCITFKNKIGFLLWVVGNVLWTIYGILTKQYFFMSQYIIFTIVSAFGYYKWLKDEKKSKNGRRKN
jgi:nicotinamide riboside transporter PnuC